MNKTFKYKCLEFKTGWSGLTLKYYKAGYFNTKPYISICIIWGYFYINLPWYHYKKIKNEKTLSEKRNDKLNIIKNPNFKPKNIYKKELYYTADPPSYGIYYYMRQIGICYGNKVKLIDMPWSYQWIRTSYLKKDNTWEHETYNKNKDFWDGNKWKDILFIEKYPYKYMKKDGTIQKRIATVKVVEREWRYKFMKWTKLYNKTIREIEVDFDHEIGENDSSWKGSIISCSYKISKKELPYNALKRMEKNRKFE